MAIFYALNISNPVATFGPVMLWKKITTGRWRNLRLTPTISIPDATGTHSSLCTGERMRIRHGADMRNSSDWAQFPLSQFPLLAPNRHWAHDSPGPTRPTRRSHLPTLRRSTSWFDRSDRTHAVTHVRESPRN